MTEDRPKSKHDLPAGDSRRRFCKAALGGMSVVAVGTVGYPVVAFLELPKSMRRQDVLQVVLADLAEGTAFWGEHVGRQIAVIKVGKDVRAFDGACPHLGCLVAWESTSRSFKCPCHGAVFNDQGEAISGPVNAPLERVDFVVKDGVLKIT